MRAWQVLASIAVLAVSACVVGVGDDVPATDADTSTSTEGDGDGDPATGDGDGDLATGDGDGDPAPGDGDGDPATGDGDGDPGACEPRDPELGVDYVLGGLADAPQDVTWTCVTTSVTNAEGLHISLDCPDAPMPVTIDIATTPATWTPIGLGALVELRYVYDGPWWFNLYLRLDLEDGQGHVLTLIDGDSLTPPAPVEFDLPIPMTPRGDRCGWVSEFCGERERYALDLEVEGQVHTLFDGQHALLGPPPGVEVWVSEAGELHAISCTDTPTHWYEILIVSPGMG